MLRQFKDVHIEEDHTETTGVHDNELFFGCRFKNLNGLTLRNCDLNRSQFLTDDIREALGFTMSLDCMSFRDVEYSDLLFDMLLVLMSMTKGNDEKRAKLLEVVGEERAKVLLRLLRAIE